MNTKHAAAQQPSPASKLVAARRAKEAQAETAAAAKPPAVRAPAAVIVPDTRPYRDRYLDEVAPASVVWRMIKFGKDGKFITSDDDQEVPEAAEYIALCDEALIGWVKFNGVGEPPDRVMGRLYDGFVMPPRESLGDLDTSEWSEGLDGKPADPWQHHQYLVLQDTKTQELFTFVTSSQTGRRAVGQLLRHFNRTQKARPDDCGAAAHRRFSAQGQPRRLGQYADVCSVWPHVPQQCRQARHVDRSLPRRQDPALAPSRWHSRQRPFFVGK